MNNIDDMKSDVAPFFTTIKSEVAPVFTTIKSEVAPVFTVIKRDSESHMINIWISVSIYRGLFEQLR